MKKINNLVLFIIFVLGIFLFLDSNSYVVEADTPEKKSVFIVDSMTEDLLYEQFLFSTITTFKELRPNSAYKFFSLSSPHESFEIISNQNDSKIYIDELKKWLKSLRDKQQEDTRIISGALGEAINELKSQGFDLPEYKDEPKTEEEKNHKLRYAKILGSAVNPVLREGNSDRRVSNSVKNYIKTNPHSMGTWLKNSKSHISTMKKGDFFSNEKSTTIGEKTTAKIEFISNCNEAFLTGTAVEISPINSIDDYKFTDRTITKMLIEEFNKEVLN